MAVNGKFSPTEQKIAEILSDGFRHTREELFSCCDYLSQLSDEAKRLREIEDSRKLKEAEQNRLNELMNIKKGTPAAPPRR